MKIIDLVKNEILTINDRIDAYREAKSRIYFYKNAEMSVDGDTIYIRRIKK